MPDHTSPAKPVDWIGSSLKDLKFFPKPVKREVGLALNIAQHGGKAPSAKTLRGQGPGVLEIISRNDGDTYRAIYTVKFEDRIYVLHCFQKKSHKGIKTDKKDIQLVEARLRDAMVDYQRRHGRKRV